MRFFVVGTLYLAASTQGAVLQTREAGCTLSLTPAELPTNGPQYIVLVAMARWFTATHQGISSNWLDFSGVYEEDNSIKFLTNKNPEYLTLDSIKDVVSEWKGTYLEGIDEPGDFKDFFVTDYSCE